MLLERDEFLVTYDSTKADIKLLLTTIKSSGYSAQVVTGTTESPAPILTALPTGSALLDEAVARAQAENKPIVLDLYAEWCAPCRQMERLTFADAKVQALLAQTVFLKIDTDKETALAQGLGVAGLPDIRLVLPDGKIVRQLRSYQNAASLAAELEQLLRQAARQ